MKFCRGISQTKGRDKPFIGLIACSKCSLVFISFGNPDKGVSMSEVEVIMNSGFQQSIQKISKKG